MGKKKGRMLCRLGTGTAAFAAAVSLFVSGSVRAEESGGRAGGIRSRGVVNYADGAVVIDTADLTYLAGEIDTLERAYKTETLAALNGIRTYIRGDGTVTHRQSTLEEQPSQPSFDVLASAIRDSQSSATAIADLSGDSYFRDGKGGLLTGSSGEDASGAEAIGLAAASADDLSAGAVAYVDGLMLLGTGADNQAYYDRGYDQGYSQGYAQGTEDGYSQGYAQGMEDGYSQGYSQGTEDVRKNPQNYGLATIPVSSVTCEISQVASSTHGYTTETIPIAGAVRVEARCEKSGGGMDDGYIEINGQQKRSGGTMVFTKDEIGSAAVAKLRGPSTSRDYATCKWTITIYYQ